MRVYCLRICLLVGICLFGAGELFAGRAAFDFGRYRFPILYDGEGIRFSEKIAEISFFAPVFGADRAVVNPAQPLVRGDKLIAFPQPGEYYIKVNGGSPLKVLVLSVQEPLSSAALRLFDFVSANLVFSNVPKESEACSRNKQKYIDNWFESEEPGRLLCGCTHVFFRTIIGDRMKLLTRIVTFPGVYRWNGKIYKSSHNLTEIYLPDLAKWVLFDINYGFMVKWMDGLELAEFFHHNSAGDSGLTIVESMAKLNVHTGGPTLYWVTNNLAASDEELSNGYISSIPTAYLWRDAFRFYYSGAGYWGGALEWPKPTGTEFLPDEFLFANLHEDPLLKSAAVDWIKSFGVTPTIVTPASLSEMLDTGHEQLISSRPWEEGLPTK